MTTVSALTGSTHVLGWQGVPAGGRHLLLVGGGPVAAMWLRLLCAGDLPVVVVAERICDDLFDLLVEHRITWVNRSARATDLHGAWLVQAATGDPQADAQVRGWARQYRAQVSEQDLEPTSRSSHTA